MPDAMLWVTVLASVVVIWVLVWAIAAAIKYLKHLILR
jgi:hypothetical protein